MRKMIVSSKINFVVIFILLVIVPSCDVIYPEEEIITPDVTQDESNPICMEPFFVDSLPIEEAPAEILTFEGDLNPVPPKKDWEQMVGIPAPYPDKVELLFSRKQNNQDELWMAFKVGGETQVRVYLPEIDKWEIKFGVEKYDFIFADYENRVWVITRYKNALDNRYFKIYVYDEEQDDLILILDEQTTPFEGFVHKIAPSVDGTIWMLIVPDSKVNDLLVQYDPERNQVIYQEEAQDIISLGVDNQGRPITVDYYGVIQRLDPVTGESRRRTMPTDIPGMGAGLEEFLFAEDGKVWFSDRAWFVSGEYLEDFHVLFRSTIFINKIVNGYIPFLWERPDPQVDTADGRIWYRSSRGLTWHQPETGEWCMFTTAQSNIVKDSEDNLWIIYDNSLYMLPASETKARDD